MIWQLVVAGSLSGLGAAAHYYFGEKDAISYVLKTDIMTDVKFDVRIVWHMFSALMLISALVLLAVAFGDPFDNSATADAVVRFIAIQQIIFGVMFGVGQALRSRQKLLANPQWLLLALIGIFAWWGTL